MDLFTSCGCNQAHKSYPCTYTHAHIRTRNNICPCSAVSYPLPPHALLLARTIPVWHCLSLPGSITHTRIQQKSDDTVDRRWAVRATAHLRRLPGMPPHRPVDCHSDTPLACVFLELHFLFFFPLAHSRSPSHPSLPRPPSSRPHPHHHSHPTTPLTCSSLSLSILSHNPPSLFVATKNYS